MQPEVPSNSTEMLLDTENILTMNHDEVDWKYRSHHVWGGSLLDKHGLTSTRVQGDTTLTPL